MSNFSRRDVLKTALTGATMAALPSAAWPQSDKPIARKGNIKQSVSRWCYQKIPLEQLCEYSAHIGLKAVDLLEVSEWEVPKRYGLICSMGYAGGGTIPKALNRVETHAAIEENFRKNIPLAAKAEFFCHGNRLHGEGFVEFVEIDFFVLPSRLLPELAHAGNGRHHHPSRLDSTGCLSHDPRQGLCAELASTFG